MKSPNKEPRFLDQAPILGLRVAPSSALGFLVFLGSHLARTKPTLQGTVRASSRAEGVGFKGCAARLVDGRKTFHVARSKARVPCNSDTAGNTCAGCLALGRPTSVGGPMNLFFTCRLNQFAISTRTALVHDVLVMNSLYRWLGAAAAIATCTSLVQAIVVMNMTD